MLLTSLPPAAKQGMKGKGKGVGVRGKPREEQDTSLHDAARNGDVREMDQLLGGVRLPERVNARDRHSRTP